MEKRRSERKDVDLLKVGLTCNNLQSYGVIENITEYGLHLITASKKSEESLIPENMLEIEFRPPFQTKANLLCEIRWVHINKTPLHGLTYRIGMEVVKYPTDYNKLLNTL